MKAGRLSASKVNAPQRPVMGSVGALWAPQIAYGGF